MSESLKMMKNAYVLADKGANAVTANVKLGRQRNEHRRQTVQVSVNRRAILVEGLTCGRLVNRGSSCVSASVWPCLLALTRG
jgi:hypothetical protein